jgi:hypothetical protein
MSSDSSSEVTPVFPSSFSNALNAPWVTRAHQHRSRPRAVSACKIWATKSRRIACRAMSNLSISTAMPARRATTTIASAYKPLFEHALRPDSGITMVVIYSFSRLFRDNYLLEHCRRRLKRGRVIWSARSFPASTNIRVVKPGSLPAMPCSRTLRRDIGTARSRLLATAP